VFGLGAVAGLAPHDGVPEGAFGGVVGGGHIGGVGEGPQRGLVGEQAAAEASSLVVALAGAAGQQVMQAGAVLGGVGLQRGQVCGVAVWLLEDRESVGQAVGQSGRRGVPARRDAGPGR
jgi:hypothetical protein